MRAARRVARMPEPLIDRYRLGNRQPGSLKRGRAAIDLRILLPAIGVLWGFLLSGIPMYANAAPPGLRQNTQDPLPIMAYYYIWYTPESWERAKTDLPLLGRYSSDDRAVMEQHVRWAKEAGISGFIVSWKSSFQLDRRLEQLMDVAAENDFYLWVIYQGLDFDRNPLPIDQIDADFEYFIRNYADHPAFEMYERPIIIWSGTWMFSVQQIETIADSYRGDVHLLASERNLEGIQRLSGLVDGNAYYWSSVNPDTFAGYQEKLDAMGQEVHRTGGLWVAPAAPGFDARLVGGASVVEREDGETLRKEMDAALQSSPDAIGLISWNEFSENSHIEPSQNYGARALDTLADIRNGVAPVIVDFDSSAPGVTDTADATPVYVLVGTFVFILGSVAVVAMRPIMHKKARLDGES
ncbi:MAG: hypothetical protein JXA78_11410 [Anaerolineales bacterium]|nr:hypothetical protein [Anaerolineales bacterium]